MAAVWAFSFVGIGQGQVVSENLLQAVSPAERADTLFERLGEDRTGIAFENRFDHPRRWLELWKQYYNGSIGTGVAIGDVDADGWPDVFLVGKDSPNALYRNRGDFRFDDVTESAGVAGGEGFGTGASFVDIDNDGDLDLYVCYVAGANELFLNDGNGGFAEAAAEWGLDFEAGSNAPSFADYDRDGDLDLYLQQNYLYGSGHLDGMPDRLFRNEGEAFVDVAQTAGIEGEGQGHTALWWDYDEDGWPDIYVSNDFEPVDKLYRNNGDGTFTDVIKEALGGAPYSSMGVDAGDLNNDGHLELFAAEMLARDREYYHRAVGPLSGKLISARRSGVNQYMQNMLWSPVGPGAFVEVSRYAGLHATDWTWAVRIADLDNDGWQDVFVANGMTRAFHDGDLAIKMTQARSLSTRVRIYEKSPPLRERNLAYRNRGELRFEEVGEAWGLDESGVSFAAALADLDRDGDLDLLTSNWKEPIGVYRNNSPKGKRILLELEGARSNRQGVGARVELRAGDLKMVRELSLMRGYLSADEPLLHFAWEGGPDEASATIRWPSGLRQRLRGLKAGRAYRIREGGEDPGGDSEGGRRPWFARSSIRIPKEAFSREERFAARKGQFLLPFTEDRLGPPLALADLDGDGWTDIVLGGATGQATRLLRNREGEGLDWAEGEAFEEDDLAEDSAIVCRDFNGDGKIDLFVASGGVELDAGDEYYEDRLYLNRGDMRFERGEADFEPTPTRDAIALQKELLLAGGTKRDQYPETVPNERFLLAGDAFEAASADRFGTARTTRWVSADLNGDGSEDLVQLREYAAPLAWRGGEDGFEPWPEVFASVESGLWKSVAVEDFDGNGLPDILLGGLGENNKYAVGPDRAAVLLAPRSESEAYAGKYIEAEELDGRLFPRESRIFHQVDFPDIAERTGTYEAFSTMTVEEAFGAETVSRYERYAFSQRSSLLVSQVAPNEFEARALAGLAQAGVAIESLAYDFDRDGDVDALLVLESLSPQPAARVHPETSFLLLLENDGSGGFRSVLPWESGLEVDVGEPRRLALADLDGDGVKELVVSVSEGPLAVFRSAVGK